ncbi:MAG: acyl-CoA dehydrogenase, partial [Gammaproteobacteria bacterium]|nr:acyl-CoA dehydrogenase [Gammaproteobacteria bacterium]
PGIAVRPIRLISGDSLFCETTFDDAVACKEDLVGKLNEGWSVGKRLLQHERAAVASYGGAVNPRAGGPPLPVVAREYAGGVVDTALRRDLIAHSMNDLAFRLTRRRTSEEARGGTSGPATSIFKMYATELEQAKASLLVSMRGTQGLGWSGDGFDQPSLEGTRNWLWSRAASIYSGTNEIQRNIIAKRVLGLPD